MTRMETSETNPKPEVLDALVAQLHVPPTYFYRAWLESTPPLYRSLAVSGRQARSEVAVLLRWSAQLNVWLRKEFALDVRPVVPTLHNGDPRTLSTTMIEAAAVALRERWGLGRLPIENLVKTVEGHGIAVAMLDMGDNDVDGCSALVESRVGSIVTNTSKRSRVRSRFDLAHELGHLVLHRAVVEAPERGSEMYQLLEKQAHQFAGAFLVPARCFEDEFWSPDPRHLLQMRQRWGMSVAACIHRAATLNLIDERESRRAWMRMNILDWRRGEPGDGTEPMETPSFASWAIRKLYADDATFEQHGALSMGLGIHDIRRLTGLTAPGDHGAREVAA